jgi:hypothetical protein
MLSVPNNQPVSRAEALAKASRRATTADPIAALQAE